MFTLVMEQADINFPGYNKEDCVITTTQLCYAGDNYEEEIDHETGTATQYHYIRGSTGLTAVFIANDDSAKTDNLYYIHQDYLGSILCLSDEEGNPVELYSFDAWGHRRNPTNWSKWQGDSTDYIVNRGFTGHEHMDVFGLINMNGRIYDPGLGRFLSPDPYVQMPDNSQNFNRYAYCLNNPLIYTDPSGEFIFTALAVICYSILSICKNYFNIDCTID
ncbi:MAG: RHS repeat domain-containing protein [Bacteroidales bacterium]